MRKRLNNQNTLIAYVRVSTEEQARGGVSLGDQEAKIRAYAALVGFATLRVEVDAGRSGKDLNRPALTRAIDSVLAGEAGALAVFAIDRLSRSTLDFLTVINRLDRAGRGFISVREQMDTNTPHGRFSMTILAAMAEMERAMIRARCRDAARWCRDTNRVYGKIPFGFDRVGKDLVPNEGEAAILEQIVGAVSGGSSLRAVAADLNARGVRAKGGGIWYASSIRSVVNTAKSA